MTDRKVNRRSFLGTAFVAGSAPLVLPSRVWGERAPSRTLNVAIVGGAPARNVGRQSRVRVVALCDVDDRRLAGPRKDYPDAAAYHDFRVMLDEMADDIDALVIGTPDHSHFPIAILAMSMGKHVFVEKPLANTFHEAELLMAAEKKYQVACQMGNQGHSGGNYHQFKAFAEAGLLDGVTKVVSHFNRGRRWHPWGDVPGFPEGEPVPEGLHWHLWHTTAEERPFSGRYHPGNWRGWYRYGMGAIGDWGPHILDTAHRFLELGLPTEVELVHVDRHNAYVFPYETTLRFHFPARGDKPPVEVYWYDGTANRPPEGQRSGTAGKVLLGGKYDFEGGTHSATLQVIPEAVRKEVEGELPRFSTGSNHYQNFVLAALGEEKSRSSFDVAGPLNQVFNLGVIAQELGLQGQTLAFDPQTKRFVDNEAANTLLVGPPPRKSWEFLYQL
jgi:predicted dehydrogenase